MQQTIDGTKQVENHAVDESTGLDLDTTFHLLQNERRRLALRALLDRRGGDGRGAEIGPLAEQVAAWEHDTTVAGLDSDQRQRVYISLYQSHLPTLDNHGVVDYDQARGQIELRGQVDALEPYLETTLESGVHDATAEDPPPAPESEGREESEVGRGLSHLLLGASVLVLLAAVVSHIGPESAVSLALLALVLCATAVLSGGVQRYVTSVRDT